MWNRAIRFCYHQICRWEGIWYLQMCFLFFTPRGKMQPDDSFTVLYTSRLRVFIWRASRGLEKFPVSTEVQLQIACMAEERHELLAEDERILFQHRRSITKMENSRDRLLQEDINSLTGERIGDREQSLRVLRLAYFYFPDNIYILSSAVRQVRYQIQQDTSTWKECFAREFMLLPLKVLSYIKGRKVNEF